MVGILEASKKHRQQFRTSPNKQEKRNQAINRIKSRETSQRTYAAPRAGNQLNTFKTYLLRL